MSTLKQLHDRWWGQRWWRLPGPDVYASRLSTNDLLAEVKRRNIVVVSGPTTSGSQSNREKEWPPRAPGSVLRAPGSGHNDYPLAPDPRVSPQSGRTQSKVYMIRDSRSEPMLSQRVGPALIDALGLPPRTRKFTLTVEVNKVVVCVAEYFPDAEGAERLARVLKEFKLAEVPAATLKPKKKRSRSK